MRPWQRAKTVTSLWSNSMNKSDYHDVQDCPEAQDANEEAREFVASFGGDIWEHVGEPMAEGLAKALGEKSASEMIHHFKNSPILRVVFYAGLSNGYTNALMIDKQKRERMAAIRERN
jgi:hypothetical protein